MRNFIKSFFLISIIFVVGCAGVDAAAQKQLTFTGTDDTKYPAKPKNAPIDLFFSATPDKEYTVIGEVSGNIVGEPKEVLKAKARQVGADAVIITEISSKLESSPSRLGVEQRSRPADIITPVYTPGYSYKIYTVKAKVIKYK